jgi:putative proteasome-type protease
MHIFSREGERVICLLTSGNLSITQSVLALIRKDAEAQKAGADVECLLNRDNLFDTVRYVGTKLREVRRADAEALNYSGLSFNANFILGGQIGTEPPQIYQIYSEGNAIHASIESPFLQIGELKYGKPILDRGFNFDTPLSEAVKYGILSLDATAKSNLSVGPPFEVFAYEAGSLRVAKRMRLDEHDLYLHSVQEKWQQGLIALVRSIPTPEFPQ